MSAAGASAGTGAANSEASTFEKSACGFLRWMTIERVALWTTMPPMWWPSGFFAKASAPRMFRKNAAPTESSRKSRSTACLKSLALTGVPFE